MGKLILVTGGARSGKSRFAEERLWDKKSVSYIATGISPADDEEWQERVHLHQKRRPQTWQTQEQYADIGALIKKQDCKYYLLDCATMLTTNLLFETVNDLFPDKASMADDCFLSRSEQEMVTSRIDKEWGMIVEAVRQRDITLYIVTNEIGLGIVPETKLNRYFRDLLGSINQQIAKEASEVYMVICGLAQRLK